MLEKTFRPDEVEKKHYRAWEQSGAFAAAERLNLDGLLALWHPSPVN